MYVLNLTLPSRLSYLATHKRTTWQILTICLEHSQSLHAQSQLAFLLPCAGVSLPRTSFCLYFVLFGHSFSLHIQRMPMHIPYPYPLCLAHVFVNFPGRCECKVRGAGERSVWAFIPIMLWWWLDLQASKKIHTFQQTANTLFPHLDKNSVGALLRSSSTLTSNALRTELYVEPSYYVWEIKCTV